MPVQPFVNGEVLSAARLNALVEVANRATRVSEDFMWPFECVQSSGAPTSWIYLMRYRSFAPNLNFSYYTTGGNNLQFTVLYNGLQAYTRSSTQEGNYGEVFSLASAGLIDGLIYRVTVSVVPNGNYFRLRWLMHSN